MRRKLEEGESNTTKGKGLFNIGEQRKMWLKGVSSAAGCYDNDVICMLIDLASVEDAENYAVRMKKFKAKRQIEDIERREKALQEEKETLVKALEEDHAYA